MENNIVTKVTEIVSDVLDVPVDSLQPTSNLVEDFEMDSMLALEVQTQIEQEFSIIVDDDDFANFNSIKDIAKVVEKSN